MERNVTGSDYEKTMGREILDDMIASEAYFNSLIESGIWLTGRGEKIRIIDMSTKHIKNCLAMLYEYGGNEYCIEALERELSRRK